MIGAMSGVSKQAAHSMSGSRVLRPTSPHAINQLHIAHELSSSVRLFMNRKSRIHSFPRRRTSRFLQSMLVIAVIASGALFPSASSAESQVRVRQKPGPRPSQRSIDLWNYILKVKNLM